MIWVAPSASLPFDKTNNNKKQTNQAHCLALLPPFFICCSLFFLNALVIVRSPMSGLHVEESRIDPRQSFDRRVRREHRDTENVSWRANDCAVSSG